MLLHGVQHPAQSLRFAIEDAIGATDPMHRKFPGRVDDGVVLSVVDELEAHGVVLDFLSQKLHLPLTSLNDAH